MIYRCSNGHPCTSRYAAFNCRRCKLAADARFRAAVQRNFERARRPA